MAENINLVAIKINNKTTFEGYQNYLDLFGPEIQVNSVVNWTLWKAVEPKVILGVVNF